MGLGLGISVDWASLVPYYAKVASAFAARVKADGGTVENTACLKKDLKALNPTPPPAFTGLLNTYSGAAAAYSLRLLDNTYSGNAIKVRRSSDNAEQDIAFVNNELDTASLETFAGAGDAFVTTWYDQSGSGNDATQTTAASQPLIVSSGSTILDNNKPVMISRSTATKLLTSVSLSADQDVTSFFTGTNAVSSRSIALTWSGNKYLYAADNGSSSSPESLGEFSNRLNGSTFTLTTRDAMYDATTTQSLLTAVIGESNNLISLQIIGWSSSWNMWRTQELIIYNSDKSSDLTGIETNINDFYSIY